MGIKEGDEGGLWGELWAARGGGGACEGWGAGGRRWVGCGVCNRGVRWAGGVHMESWGDLGGV